MAEYVKPLRIGRYTYEEAKEYIHNQFNKAELVDVIADAISQREHPEQAIKEWLRSVKDGFLEDYGYSD